MVYVCMSLISALCILYESAKILICTTHQNKNKHNEHANWTVVHQRTHTYTQTGTHKNTHTEALTQDVNLGFLRRSVFSEN